MRFVNLSMHVVTQIVLSSQTGYVIMIPLLNRCVLSDLYIIKKLFIHILIIGRGASGKWI